MSIHVNASIHCAQLLLENAEAHVEMQKYMLEQAIGTVGTVAFDELKLRRSETEISRIS